MGQYYKVVILSETVRHKELIRTWLHPWSYNTGQKLMEHSYIKNPFVQFIMYLLSPMGNFQYSRIVWAGDYADEEQHENKNLHHITEEDQNQKLKQWQGKCPEAFDPAEYRYLVNHDTKRYVDIYRGQSYDEDKDEIEFSRVHPLPLLTAEGNGRGGGDYRGKHEDAVGSWARNLISVEKEPPEFYSEYKIIFREN